MSKINQVIERDEYGNMMYRSLSRSEQIKADEFLTRLQALLPQIEEELKGQFEISSLDFKYELGKRLAEFLEKEGFSKKESGYVFSEIRRFVPTGLNDAIKDRSEKRAYYEYCYRLYCLGHELAHAFNYHFWSDVFDRVALDTDKRIYHWFYKNKASLPDKTYRFFAKAMTLYLKEIDTSVLTDDEYFEACDLCLTIAEQYKAGVKEFFAGKESNMSKARAEKLGKYKNKYVELAVKNLRFEAREQWASICREAFIEIFVNVDKTSQNLKKASD